MNTNGSGSNSQDNFERDLFLCALLTQKIEIAKLFWREGKDHIGSALIGSTICRYLSYRARKRREEEKMNEFTNYSIEFEEAAKAILSEAYKKDPVRAHLLLIRTLPDWENETCLEIAKKSLRINFLSETAVATKIYLIWLGGIPSTVNTYMIIFNIPLGLLYLFVASGLLLRDFIMSLKCKKVKQDAKPGGSEPEEEYAGFECLNKLRVEHEKSKMKLRFYKTFPYIYEAPVTKFMMNLVSYVTFLTCFTYVLLIELNTISQSSTIYQRKVEYVIYVFYLSFIMEDVRQLTMNSNRHKNDCRSKWIKWQSSYWNILGLVTYIFFGISFILRQTVNDSDFVYCRSMFAITLSLFYIKFMQFYYTQKSIGPKVMMINHMLKDLGFFLAIYLIALFAYGTFALALLYPNRSPNDSLLKNIVYNPYWQLFGQVDLTYMEGTQQNGAVATPNVLVIIANALFLLFVNILLTNILIAMFGVTFSTEESKSNRVLAYLKFRIIEEFYYRSIMPPPLNIFEIIYQIIVQIKKYSKERKEKANGTDDNGKTKEEKIGFSASLSDKERKECSDFERKCMDKCWKNKQLFLQSKFPETKEKNLQSNKTDILYYSNVNLPMIKKLLNIIRKKRRVTKKNNLHVKED